MEHSEQDFWQLEKDLEQILLSSLDPITKVRRIIGMGVEEDEANEMVERYQIGQMAPVYYERLTFDEEFEETEED